MLYIVMVTPSCNLSCSYCGGSLVGMPQEITYDISRLSEIVGKDREAVVAFYGGEPLLRTDVVKSFLYSLPARKFVLQTNGYFVRELGDDVGKFDTILLSIDGRKEITDRYRAPGCYDKVMDALHFLREKGYGGDIIARMAVSKYTDIYEDVVHLLRFFPHVHWQLDVVWSPLWELEEFEEWAERSYMPGIEHLVEMWAGEVEGGNVPGIVPFLGIMKRMIWGREAGRGLPCGAGQEAVAITTDGRVLACPIAGEFLWNNLGDLHSFGKVELGEPCRSCDVYDLCGGRCLCAYKEQLWGDEGFRAVCRVTRHLIHELEGVKDRVVGAMERIPGMEERLRYPAFNNTTEIIP